MAPPMTAPRQILPGRTYLVTRRCLDRQFFLRPSAVVNQILAYVLGCAAQRYGVQIHAYCVLSNHLHLVLTDPHAHLPAFQQYLAAFVARAPEEVVEEQRERRAQAEQTGARLSAALERLGV